MIKYIFLFTSISCLFACERPEDIVDFPKHTPHIVINGLFTTEKPIAIHLSRSLSALDNAPLSDIENGTVRLYRDDVLAETISSNDEGIYYSNVMAQSGSAYRVEAEAPGYEMASATDAVLAAQPFQFISAVINSSSNWGNELTITLRLNDPGEDNYYGIGGFVTYINYNSDSTSFEIDTQGIHFYTDDDLIDPSMYYGDVIWFSDELFNGTTQDLQFLSSAHNGPTYHLKLYHISKSYYLYQKTLIDYLENYGNPFAELVKVYTNV